MKLPWAELEPGERTFALGGGIAFVAALGYFLYSYEVTFGRLSQSPEIAGPLTWDVMLFSAFALHHSIFARERIRAWVTRTWGRLERSVYVWIASVLFVATCFFWQPLPGIAWDAAAPFAWPLRGLQLVGVFLALRSAAIIDIWDLSGIKVEKTEGDFKRVGPYAWVRHPIYLGWFLIVFAAPFMTMTRLVFAVVSSAYVLVAIPFEERSLRTSSSGAYERYAQQTPWKVVPFIF